MDQPSPYPQPQQSVSSQPEQQPVSAQPQPGTAQPQQPQYGYAQPQYGYAQPQQPQYGYAQPQYGFPTQPPYPSAPTPLKAPSKRAVGSMVLMIIALSLLSLPIIFFIAEIADSPRRILIYWEETVAYLGILSLLAGVILMMIGAIRGTRGRVLFGVGILVVVPFVFLVHLLWMLEESSVLDRLDSGTTMMVCCILLASSLILAGIGVLARIRGMSIAGGASAIVFLMVMCIGYFDLIFYVRKEDGQAMEILGLIGFILLCVSVTVFPVRKQNQ